MSLPFPPIWDQNHIWEIQQRIRRCASVQRPNIQFLSGDDRSYPAPASLAVFASSFNPPTIAHETIIQHALSVNTQAKCLLLLDLQHADKPSQDALTEDRALMMQIAFARDERLILGVSSHGRFMDKCAALDTLGFATASPVFLVGMDTFARMIDPRFYSDPDRELETLFSRAQFLVFSRSTVGSSKLALLNDWARRGARIERAALPEDIKRVSSSLVRAKRASGDPLKGFINDGIGVFIEDTGLYLPTPPHPPVYEARKALLNSLLSKGPEAFLDLDMRQAVLTIAHAPRAG